MKRYASQTLVLMILSTLLFQGFQCGSPEFTGAKVHLQQKNYKEAARLLEIEVQKNPANEEAWFFLGGLKADESDYAGMNRAFDEALKLSDKHASEIQSIRHNHWGQNLNSGVVYLERASADSAEYYEKSIESFNKAIAAKPDTGLTYKYLAYAYSNKGDHANALDMYRKSWDLAKDPESLKRAGRIHIVRGEEHKTKFENANADKIKKVKILEDVKKTSRKDDIKQSLGDPDNIKKGPRGTKKEEWTYNAYKLTVFVDGEKVTDKRFATPYDPQIDSTEFKAGQIEYRAAVELLERANAADPKDNETLNTLLKAYVESNRIAQAVKAFEQAIVNEPGNKTNHYILGVLYRQLGDFTKAIEQFGETLKIDPNDVEATFDLGATYYNWGVDLIKSADEKGEPNDSYKPKFEAALPLMERVTEMKKDDATVWETLGTIYARLGNQDKALNAFEQADRIRKAK